MQADKITLAVDVQNNGTPVNQEFVRSNEEINRTVYSGPGHSLISRNQLVLTRSYPKRTGNYYGAAKSAIKFTRDLAVAQADGTTTQAPLIMEVSVSMPVGSPTPDLLALRQHLVAILDNDTVCNDLQAKLIV